MDVYCWLKLIESVELLFLGPWFCVHWKPFKSKGIFFLAVLDGYFFLLVQLVSQVWSNFNDPMPLFLSLSLSVCLCVCMRMRMHILSYIKLYIYIFNRLVITRLLIDRMLYIMYYMYTFIHPRAFMLKYYKVFFFQFSWMHIGFNHVRLIWNQCAFIHG